MSTWKPNTSADLLNFSQINGSPGVYASGVDDPQFITRTPGVTVELDSTLSDTGPALTDSSFPADQKFRRLAGVLTTEFAS